MQMTARLRTWTRRSLGVGRRGLGTRHLALASVAIFVTQCAPQTCAPPPPPPPPDAPAPAPPSAHFGTLPPGSALPSSADCAARVRPAAEVRPQNSTQNGTRGNTLNPGPSHVADQLRRVDGAFTGTTDEIIQWAACKWGIDENIVRAQIAKESYWTQGNLGDWWSYPADECPPGHAPGADGRPGECPQSVGLGQVRYHGDDDGTFPGVERSSAMNLDVTYAIWRGCYEGRETWLNDVERGRQYGAGDVWGCVGRWFSGRWYTQASNDYVAAVRDYLDRRIWTDPGFIDFRG